MSLITSQGTFFTGCNYWASHSGTAMWSDWRPEVVEKDFERMSKWGIKVLRVFPLWPDFQPITLLKGIFGYPAEYRIGEELLSDDEEGRAGVSKTAMHHFEEFATLADKYNIKFIVGLITGWMSGRLFVPPALEGRNVLTDPLAIQWEVRFVKYFVSRFKNNPAIIAWDLGNECNCMAEIPSREAAWYWTSTITNAIKSEDTVKPVISGMHSLTPESNWSILDQAEITDVLTTHPYPYFVPHCDQDPINTIRTGLHAVSETLFYRGIGGKPCFAEELGTLGPMFASDEIGADFVRNNLFTLWTHDCRGFLWWCANEQSHLTHAPYDWNAIERELGFFKLDGSPKPIVEEVSKFTDFTMKFPYETLPPRLTDGVCILTKGQDTWGAAYSSFVLAKQAGLDIEFQYSSQPIKDAGLYLLPSLNGDACISRHRMNELLEKVKKGAVLYISANNALLSSFHELTGVKVMTRYKSPTNDKVILANREDMVTLILKGTYKCNLEVTHAQIIGIDQDGNPAFTCAQYGKGKVFFLNYPLETYLSTQPGVFHENNANPYWLIYQYLKNNIPSDKLVTKDKPNIGITEHKLDENSRIIAVINYEPETMDVDLKIDRGWQISENLYGGSEFPSIENGETRVSIKNNDALIFTLKKL
jgi:endo-1,4-beta-mannosidase